MQKTIPEFEVVGGNVLYITSNYVLQNRNNESIKRVNLLKYQVMVLEMNLLIRG